MNKWQQERAVVDEMLRMEQAGEVRYVGKNARGGHLGALGKQRAFDEMKEDFGIFAPLVRLWDRVKAWWIRCGLSK
jgi:hypothetical protein